MDVVTVSLTAADAAAVAAACADLPHRVVDRSPGEFATETGDTLLAAFVGADEVPPPLPASLRAGTFAVAVTGSDTAGAVLGAVAAGYAVALRRGLDEARVRHLLGYVGTLAPPPAARHVTLTADGVLRAGGNEEHLTPDVAAFVRAVGGRPGRIVRRDDPGAADTAVLLAANAALERVGSGARILKVPHVGFRFTGTLGD